MGGIEIKTYQDMLAVGESEKARMDFCWKAITEHMNSAEVLEAEENQLYFDGMNPTITRADKFITDIFGRSVPDVWHANHKIKCQLYSYFVIQQVLFLLGNGISFSDGKTLEKLGENFEHTIIQAAFDTQNGGVSFLFLNLDHVDKFSVREFVPLYDEETGRLSAGIRHWQMADDKPVRITLYELDGYTEYIKRDGEEMAVLYEKRPYIQLVKESAAGTEIAPGESYPGFPIVPFEMYNHHTAMYGHRESIDGYDLIASKLLNNIDNFEFAYWIIKGAPALMDDPDRLNEIYQRLTASKFIALGEGQEMDEHRVEIPVEATESGLKFLRQQLFSDFMAFDPLSVAGGADTATQIRASYEPLNEKTDLFEYQVTKAIKGILKLAGIDDVPTYTRSNIINKQEEIQNVLSAAEYLDDEYITRKLLEIIGDADKADEILERRLQAEEERMEPEQDEEPEEVSELE